MDVTYNALPLNNDLTLTPCKDCMWFEWDKGPDQCVNRYHLCCKIFCAEQFENAEQ
jgi:hypothetical protein